MKLNVERPEKVIDINGLPLNKVEALSDGRLWVGALVRNSDLAHDPAVVLSGASAHLRNMATTGGNLLKRGSSISRSDLRCISLKSCASS
jgi:xanthine dehydrogenase YagS FAD-binding subunit